MAQKSSTVNRQRMDGCALIAYAPPFEYCLPRHFLLRTNLLAIFAWIFLIICFTPVQSYCENSLIRPEWKAHFTNTPVIEDCVYIRRLARYGQTDLTNIYQFKYQSNASLLRELITLDEASSNFIPRMGFYSVHYESNYWDIAAGRLLELFPDVQTLIKNGQTSAAAVYNSSAMIIPALYYGINQLDPKTVQWLTTTNFTAASCGGEQMSGVITEVADSLPTHLEWHFVDKPDRIYQIIYKYGEKLGVPYYPTDIELRSIMGDREVFSCEHKILFMTISPVPLLENIFSPSNYFRAPPFSGDSTVIYSNDNVYMRGESGILGVAPRVGDVLPLQLGVQSGPKTVLLYWICLSSSLLAIYFAWKLVNKQQKQRLG